MDGEAVQAAAVKANGSKDNWEGLFEDVTLL